MMMMMMMMIQLYLSELKSAKTKIKQKNLTDFKAIRMKFTG